MIIFIGTRGGAPVRRRGSIDDPRARRVCVASWLKVTLINESYTRLPGAARGGVT